MADVSDVAAMLDVELQARMSFVLGAVSIVAAVILRERGFIRPEDSLPLSKITFNVFLPALLLVKVSKAKISLALWPVAAVSFCVHVLLVTSVLILSRFVPNNHEGFRGQWCYSMMGSNLAYVYPIIIAAGNLGGKVFPSLVMWDLTGNVFIIFIVQFVVAMKYAPSLRPSVQDDPEAPFDSIATDISQTQDLIEASAIGKSVPSTLDIHELASALATGGDCMRDHKNKVVQAVTEHDRSRSSSKESSSLECPSSSTCGKYAFSSVLATASPVVNAPATSSTENGSSACDGRHDPQQSATGGKRKADASVLRQQHSMGTLAIVDAFAASGGDANTEYAANKNRTLVLTVLGKVSTNAPFVCQVAGLFINLSGLQLANSVDGVLESIAQPFSVLLFMIIGLNLRWTTIVKNFKNVVYTVPVRVAIHAIFLLLVWASGVLPDKQYQQAGVIALCCPVGGLTMAYTLDFGFNAGLQAALMSVTNLVSFVLLIIVVSCG